MTEITQDEADTAAICALRYAMGRMTYLVGDAADLIRHLWPSLSPSIRSVILSELREAKAQDANVRASNGDMFSRRLGMDCDRAVWVRLLSDLEGEKGG
jgi:hypothetical protein